jgi:hypothetical protein
MQLLEQYDLPMPSAADAAHSGLVSAQFLEALMRATDDESVERLVEERAALIRSACEWRNGRGAAKDSRPRSRNQLECAFTSAGRALHSAADFANAIRGR